MRKNLITLGLVSAFGASTAMAVDLTNAKDTPDVFALDSVVATDLTADDAISIDTTILDAATVGVGVAENNQVFVRIDLGNGVFDGTVSSTTTDFTISNGTGTAVAQGGLDTDGFVIFDVTGGAGGIDQTATLSLSAAVAHLAAGPATVTVGAYETLSDAINQNNALATSSGTYATTGSGMSDTGTPTNATAEVSTLFTRFDNLGLTAEIGQVTYDTTVATTGILEPDGTAHTVGDSLTAATSDIVITGDFSFGAWEINDTAGCGGATSIALTVADDEASASATDISNIEGAAGYLCVTVDGTEVINQGTYTYALEYDTVATAVFPAADGTGTVGSIAHNGTTVQVPYMTTFASYNQRFVMVNRGTTDADYTFTFTTEDGTTATAGTAATGTIPAGETLVVKATDIVTLTGNTRTAGTVVIVAPDANISVAAQQVNVADSGTDTVVLN